jgi:hypothetical protein
MNLSHRRGALLVSAVRASADAREAASLAKTSSDAQCPITDIMYSDNAAYIYRPLEPVVPAIFRSPDCTAPYEVDNLEPISGVHSRLFPTPALRNLAIMLDRDSISLQLQCGNQLNQRGSWFQLTKFPRLAIQ